MNATVETIEINGEKYIRAADAPKPKPNGNRAVVVVDRGWIFAGDVTEQDGRIRLARAVWLFRWSSVGFDGAIADPKSDKVQIRKLDNDVDIPAGAEVFRVPVDDSWGLA